ncbi:MAG: hypothetical protein DCC65_09165 [Planctomycetota bacterium]|nr:MAG: hypothetical protein DCC65_09165 [Planctomycetota bacterium]
MSKTILRSFLAAAVITTGHLLLTGCAKPETPVPESKQVEIKEPAEKETKPAEGTKMPMAAGSPAAASESASDTQQHIAFLKASLAETKKLKTLTVNFLRQERLGLLRELKPKEDIIAEHRNEPFSVRFTWNDPKSEYRQCVYVHGKEDNKVLLMPRSGLFGLPPSLQKYPAEFAVTFQKARNPITDFGPRRMMERVIDRIEKARAHGEVRITRSDPKPIGPLNEMCHHFELRYPAGDQYACKLQDLYISAATNLPVATYLWIPGKVERSDSTLDAMYMYSGLKANVALTEANFVIESGPGRPADETKTVSAGKNSGDIQAGQHSTESSP